MVSDGGASVSSRAKNRFLVVVVVEMEAMVGKSEICGELNMGGRRRGEGDVGRGREVH